MRLFSGLATVLGLVLAVVGGLLVLIGASDLEADHVYVGTILGRDSQDPSISTTGAGIACVILGVIVIAVALAGRRRGGSRSRAA